MAVDAHLQRTAERYAESIIKYHPAHESREKKEERKRRADTRGLPRIARMLERWHSSFDLSVGTNL